MPALGPMMLAPCTSARTPPRSGPNAGQSRAQSSLAHLEGKKTSSPNRPYNNILSHPARGWGYGNDVAEEDEDDEIFYDDDEDEFGLPSIASMRKKGNDTRRTQSTFTTTNAMPGNSTLGADLDTAIRPRANSSDIAEERGLFETDMLQYTDILPCRSCQLLEFDNHSPPPSDATPSQREAHSARISRINKFKRILQASTVSLSELRSLAWSGVPDEVRAMTWQLLLGYLPTNSERRVSTLERKRKEYLDGVRQAFERVSVSGGPGSTNTSSGRGRGLDEAVWHQISIDVPRTSPHLQLYSYEATQRSLERILYVWAIRHPASGYVQGINDLVTPFWQVFLGAYMTNINVEEGMDPGQLPRSVLDAVEADSFWCLTKLLDGIQDNYIYAQPGIQRQAEEQGFSRFHLYVCAAFLVKWTDRLLKMDFQEIMMFLQSLPTKEWTEKDVELLLSEAFIWQSLFQDSSAHLRQDGEDNNTGYMF
uniref:TBC1 domain family member 22B n=1 Tax=Talaromyces marneffei PM1 TaxID=1077442 RepID=A0A093VMP3_TALMA